MPWLEKLGIIKPVELEKRTDYSMECKDGVCKLIKKSGQSEKSETENVSNGVVPEEGGDVKGEETVTPQVKKVQWAES